MNNSSTTIYQVAINRETPAFDDVPSRVGNEFAASPTTDENAAPPAETTLILGDANDASSSSSSFSELLFPATAIGAAAEALLILKNGRRTSLRWRLTAFAPPYLKADRSNKQMQQQQQQQRAGAKEEDIFRVVVSSGVLGSEGEARVSDVLGIE